MSGSLRVGLPVILVAVLFLGLATPADSQARRKLTFLEPNLTPNPATPYAHIAQALGYFREEGLDVTIVHAGGGGDALKFLALGRGDIAVGTPDGLMSSVQNGDRLQSVCTYLYGYLYDIAVLATSPVKTGIDLRGKKIGITGPGSSAIPYLNAWLGEFGLSPVDVQLVSVGTQMSAFLALTRKQVDALAVPDSVSVLFDIEGVSLRRLTSTLSNKLEGAIIAARTETIEKDPVVVEAFLRAFSKAHYYYLSNPRSGVIAMSKIVPEVGKDLGRSIAMGAPIRAKSVLPRAAGGLFCWTSLRRWESMQEVLLGTGTVKRKLDPSTYFTTQFLLGANKFDRVKIKQASQAVK